jgi:peptide-methionine (S)-S-oxide reductase
LHELGGAEIRAARLKEKKMSRTIRVFAAAALVMLGAACAKADETERALPAPALDETASQPSETAVLAGGCFWGMQGVFQHVKGVRQVLAGYSGGAASTAQYETVSTGTTGHAESVKITFDPKVISYGEILRVYFSVMDPTTSDYQGPDEGTQYRSEIFADGAGQERIAKAYVAQLAAAHAFSAPIVTQVGAFRAFYPGEAYHQDYLLDHPDQPYIVINDLPKIATLKRLYPALYVEQPVRVAGNWR